MDERDLVGFEFKMSIGRITYFAQHTSLVSPGFSDLVPVQIQLIKFLLIHHLFSKSDFCQ